MEDSYKSGGKETGGYNIHITEGEIQGSSVVSRRCYSRSRWKRFKAIVDKLDTLWKVDENLEAFTAYEKFEQKKRKKQTLMNI